jgi:hypothetical protein
VSGPARPRRRRRGAGGSPPARIARHLTAGNSLTHDPKNAKTILAAGSIIQDHSDMDVALIKYRVAAVQTPNSAQLWCASCAAGARPKYAIAA